MIFWICLLVIMAVIFICATIYVFVTERPDPAICIIGVPPK